MSIYIEKKLPRLVIDALMKRWISIFGTMKSLLSDNGGEFTADEFKEVASILGVKLLTTAAESPHQNGLNERVHSVVDSILSKLKQLGKYGKEFTSHESWLQQSSASFWSES